MNSFVKRALWGTLLAGGITLLGATVANAVETTGEEGLLSGTQALVNIEVPLSIGGNALSVLGDSSPQVDTSAPPAALPPTADTSGENGAVSGTQALITLTAPITIGGNAISVIGDSTPTVSETTPPATTPAESPAPTATTNGADSTLGGTQVIPTITAPITVSGNAISVIGDSTPTVSETTPAATTPAESPAPTATTNGADSTLGGTQVIPTITAPITIGGNAISVIGDSTPTGPVPAVPTTPIVPTTPVAPTTPVVPAPPTPATAPATAAGAATLFGSSAAVASVRLAATGGSSGPALLVTGLAALAAGLGVFLLRGRSA